jgi:hypothetical protein
MAAYFQAVFFYFRYSIALWAGGEKTVSVPAGIITSS